MSVHSDTSTDLSGRTALVTGGGSGIGRTVAVELAERGMNVLVTGRRAEPLAATVKLRDGIRSLAADVTDASGISDVVRDAVDEHGRLDALVNNAGAMRPGSLEEADRAVAAALWETNVLGPTLLTRAALPYLLRSRGAVVNVSSTFGSRPAPGIGQYGASKAALEHLTTSWALELADRGVRVNAVAPGPVESEALARSGLSAAEIEQVKDDERSRIPLGRRGRPDDVARWIAMLCGPAADWVTGQVIGVDGGYRLT